MDIATKSLIAKLEAATEGSRELDVEIFAEIDGRDLRRDGDVLLARSRKPPHDECVLMRWANGVAHEWQKTPHYTTSLDAALTLVPEGFDIDQIHKRQQPEMGGRMWYATIRGWSVFRSDYQRTLPLALCIAALRARGIE